MQQLYKFFIIFLLCSHALLFGQTVSGTVFEKSGKQQPVEFVNIGIIGKNVGTVSDQNGKYSLKIESKYTNDTLKFSCIGYQPYSVKVSDFMKQNNGNVSLEKSIHKLAEVVVRPKKIKSKTLGVTTQNKNKQLYFRDSVRGFEMGILMSNKKTAFIKTVNINIAECTYDTIFYRINIYKAHKKMQFENILHAPIYVKSSKQDAKNKITIDVRHLNLVVKGDFLVTIENVKNLGLGKLAFPFVFLHKTYGRETSQDEWSSIPFGISLSVDADVEI